MGILGMTGKIGAGKTTVSEYIVQAYGFQSLSFVDKILAPRLIAQGKEINRHNLQDLGSELYLKHGDILLTQWLLEGLDPAQRWLIDDIRYPSTATYIREEFASAFVLVGVSSSQSIRYERVVRRARETVGSFEEFVKMDNALTEQRIEQVMDCTDYIIDNSGNLQDLYLACKHIMLEILHLWG